MATEVKDLPANTWVLVLQSVTSLGQVHTMEIEEPAKVPSDYLIAIVGTGDPAPTATDGIRLGTCTSFSAASSASSDYYMRAVGADGRVSILT